MPRKWHTVAAMGFILLATGARFADVLRGRVFRFGAIAVELEPLWCACARAMRSGDFGMWSGGAWAGVSLLERTGYSYPPHWSWLVLPPLRAYALAVVAHSAWLGIGMFALCRTRGRSSLAATWAAVAASASGWAALAVTDVVLLEALSWAPWVAVLTARLGAGDARALPALATSAALMILTSGTAAVTAGFVFAGLMFYERASPSSPHRQPPLPVVSLAAAVLLGVCLAAPGWLPGLINLHDTSQSAQVASTTPIMAGGLRALDVGVLPLLLVGYTLMRRPSATATSPLLEGTVIGTGITGIGFAGVVPVVASGGSVAAVVGTLGVVVTGIFTLAAPVLAAHALDALGGQLAPRRGLIAAAAAALVAATPLELWLFHRSAYPTVTVATARQAVVPAVLPILASGRGARFASEAALGAELTNGGLLWGLEGVSGQGTAPTERYRRLLCIANHGTARRCGPGGALEPLHRFTSPIVDALGVLYLVAPADSPRPGTHWARHASPAPDLVVFHNTHALPRSWVVHQAVVARDADASARAVAAATFDPSAAVVLEGPLAAVPGPSTRPGRPVDMMSASGGEIKLGVTLDAPGFVVLSKAWNRGWRARLDGTDVPVLIANHALLAIAVPSGEHMIQLELASWPFDIAQLLAVLACGAVFWLFRRSGTAGRSMEGHPRP